MVDIIGIKDLSKRIEIIQSNKHYLGFLSQNEIEYSNTLQYAVSQISNENDFYFKNNSLKFILGTIAYIINKPTDLLAFTASFNSIDLIINFLTLLVKNDFTSEQFLSGLGGNKNVMLNLPLDINWAEIPMHAYAAEQIKKNQLLSVEDLIPIGPKLFSNVTEYILGWAFEENKLTNDAIDYFELQFNKKYLQLVELKNSKL